MAGGAGRRSDGDSQFRIEATGAFHEPRTRILKHGDTFAVLSSFGDMVGDAGCPDGLYHQDTRFLSQLELRLNGACPLLLSSNQAEDNSLLPVDLANADTVAADGSALQRELIYVNRRQFVWRSAFYELLLVRNFDMRRHVVTIDLRFAADFADIFEVRGQKRARRGEGAAELVSPDTVALRYRGLDGKERISELRFAPAPARLDTTSATFTLDLGPGKGCRLALRICCDPADPDPGGHDRAEHDPGGREDWTVRQFYRSLRAAQQGLRAASGRAASIEGSNAVFNELARRSVADLYMLTTDTEYGPYPFAGIPWYSTFFGRDGIITALMALWVDPAIARGVLGFLAATQATETDHDSDAEPGKILHEMRKGEMARLGEVPFARYYGSVDATPLFVMLMGEYFARTGDLDTVRRLWPNVTAALHWIDTEGDPDRDGFVEYHRQRATGLINQGWKDSAVAIFHADGELAQGPIALCEVQGYVFAAKRHAATLALALGEAATAARLETEAEILRRNFEGAFWCEELSTYALALDGAKRPCRVIASNAGHALLTGIAAPNRAERVAATLMRAGSFSGWGIRTVALTAARYNPISYHNGSVWPHDNALVALGLARYGLKEPALRVFTGLFDAASYWEPRRLPELFCGFARHHTAPTMYPVACAPQAWASAAIFALVQASLGLHFDHRAGEIRFDRPLLPDFLERLHVRGLRLGAAEADVLFHRFGSEVAATVTRRRGAVRIVVIH
ncbi:MAG TPA: amylo-alpha-1,6-glucosidase [Stellaceae bacterium]|nr:amylo-alpha-1,6-glucosidase [Stellaceae bacterium]